MKKTRTFIYCIIIALTLAITITGCSQNYENSPSIEHAAHIGGYDLPVQYIQYTAPINEDINTSEAINCTSETTVSESWIGAYQYRQVPSLTLGADNVFVGGFTIKLPEDILPNDIYDVSAKHMGNMDSVMALAIWDSASEVEKLLFTSLDNYSILLVLKLTNLDGKVIGHSITHSPIYNALTHECYSVELEGIVWERIWSPDILSDDSQYLLKQVAHIILAADSVFISGNVFLPSDIQADDVYSVDVKHVGDMNSILTLDIWDSIADVESLFIHRANAIPVYIVLEFADFDGHVLGHSLKHAPASAHDVGIEWHTVEIEGIEQGKVWTHGSSNAWHGICLSCCLNTRPARAE